MRLVVRDPEHYRQETIHRHEVVVYPKDANSRQWEIVVPNSLNKDLMNWYHTVLDHAGIEKLINAVGDQFHIPNLRMRAEEAIQMCPEKCQDNTSRPEGAMAISQQKLQ